MKYALFVQILVPVVTMLSEFAYAAEPSIVGTWKLHSYLRHDVETGESTRPWGERPAGYLAYLPDGHMIVVMTSEGRQLLPPADNKFLESSSQLIFNMSAYAGKYAVQDRRVIHHVDVAWLPAWVGTDQPREFHLDGDSLTIRTQAIRNARDGREYFYTLEWKRAMP